MALKFYTSVKKGSKVKVRKFWGSILTFVEVSGEKLVGGGAFVPPFPSYPSHPEFLFFKFNRKCMESLLRYMSYLKDWNLSIQTNMKLTACYYHATYKLQCESTLYSCLDIKELVIMMFCWNFVSWDKSYLIECLEIHNVPLKITNRCG